MMNTVNSSFTPLSRHDHAARLMTARENHPWLAHHHIDPAPGHWAVLEDLFKTLEVLLPADQRASILLHCTCATLDESLKISCTLNAVGKRRVHLVEAAIRKAEQYARVCCAFCGARVSANHQGTRRCVMHTKEIRLFADDPAGADAFPLDDWANHKKRAQEAFNARQAKTDEEAVESGADTCADLDAADIEQEPAPAEDDTAGVLRVRFTDKTALEAFVTNASSH